MSNIIRGILYSIDTASDQYRVLLYDKMLVRDKIPLELTSDAIGKIIVIAMDKMLEVENEYEYDK